LRILEVIGEYQRDIAEAWGIEDFNVRVGVNSGPTAVGVVGGAAPQTVALGDATNVAARLQSVAEPGTVAVGDATAQRLSQRFVLEPLGVVPVKGRAEPVLSWRLIGPRPQEEAASITPFVDRERELESIRAVVDELKAGRGQILLLSGEAGTGKTRLIGELRTMAGDEVTWLEGHCSSYLREITSRPFIDAFRTWVGMSESEPELAARTKLRARLGPLFGSALDEALPFLARMLSIRLDPETDEALRARPPQELEEVTRQAYASWIERVAGERPVALILESFQWAYPSTRELAEVLLALTDRAPVLLVLTFRPDPSSEAWRLRLRALADYAHRSVEVQVGPFSEEAGLRLIDALLPPGLVPDALKQEILQRAEGNPLYIEELMQALVAAGGDRRRTWSLGGDPSALLPPALESLFVARIDRLAAGPRRLAQEAAVIGRTFSVPVLKKVADSEDVDAELAGLLRADVVRELRRYPQLECTFKHGLLQEAALSTLTSARLRELYGKVGRAFEEQFADVVEDQLETLAFYFYRSDDQRKALDYLERAAAKADSTGVRAQAVELWERARKVAIALGDTDAERRASERLEKELA
jgi:predicted ATPase